MHFLAMLAFSLPVSISYNFLLTIVSLLAAILASGLALSIVSHPKVSFSILATRLLPRALPGTGERRDESQGVDELTP